jgi:hypothetical protein
MRLAIEFDGARGEDGRLCLERRSARQGKHEGDDGEHVCGWLQEVEEQQAAPPSDGLIVGTEGGGMGRQGIGRNRRK